MYTIVVESGLKKTIYGSCFNTSHVLGRHAVNLWDTTDKTYQNKGLYTNRAKFCSTRS